jgi:hypothetical protein
MIDWGSATYSIFRIKKKYIYIRINKLEKYGFLQRAI